MKKVVRLTESDLIRLVKRIIKEEEGEMSPPQNDSKIKELLGALTKNLWHQLGTGDYKKPSMDSVLYDVAKNITINGYNHPGYFVYRKKKTRYLTKDFMFGEIALTKDKKKVNLYNEGDFKQYILDDDTSFNELMNLISSKEFTQY